MSKSNTRVMFIKYHEAADQQPLSKKAAEKLGIFPSLPLGGIAAWIRQNGFPVELIDLHVENIFPADAASRVRDYDPKIVALTVFLSFKNLIPFEDPPQFGFNITGSFILLLYTISFGDMILSFFFK